MEHFVDISKAPLPVCRRFLGQWPWGFATIKKLPTSASVGLSSVPVTDRGSEEVNVSFSDFGAGVGLVSGRLVQLTLDCRAETCLGFQNSQAAGNSLNLTCSIATSVSLTRLSQFLTRNSRKWLMLRIRYSAKALRLSPQTDFDRGRFGVVVAQVKTSRDDEGLVEPALRVE
jgi:hypothetical protein